MGALRCTNLLTGASAEELDYTKVLVAAIPSLCGRATDSCCYVWLSHSRALQIYFNHIPDEAIQTMIQEGFVYYCAGGLMVEHPQCSPYIASVEGTMDSIMGIEPSLVHKLVRQVTAGP